MQKKRKVFRIVLVAALCISLGTTIYALGMYMLADNTASETGVYRTISMFAGPIFFFTLIVLAFMTKKRSPEEILRDAHGKCGIQHEVYK